MSHEIRMPLRHLSRALRRGLGRRLARLRSTDRLPARDPVVEAARLETIRRARELAKELKAGGFRYDDPVLQGRSR